MGSLPLSGDTCGCWPQAEDNTGTYGTEAEEAAKHLIIHRTGPQGKNELAQDVNGTKCEDPDFRSFRFPSPGGRKREMQKAC